MLAAKGRLWRPLRRGLGHAAVFVAIAAAMALIARLLLQPSGKGMFVLTGVLAASGAAAWLLGYGGLWLARVLPWGGLRVKIAVPVLAGVLTALAGIVVTARLMFIAEHDLALLTLLLLFALAISLPIALAASKTLAGQLRVLGAAADAVAEGRLDTRVQVAGADEIGHLAAAFNVMAERLEAAQTQQAAMEKTRQELVAAISHDLRTPLASIQAMVEAIGDRVVDEATVPTYLNNILAETRRLSGLIADLFEFSQIDAGTLRLRIEETDIGDLISDTLNSMRPQAEQRGVRLEGNVEAGAGSVMADGAKVERVLGNLVQNSLRHTPSGGSVMVEAQDTGSELLISVSDSGEGITDEDLPHIFDSFYRGDRVRSKDGGAGLGLAIAKGIVEAHHGRIWVVTAPGEGARFSFGLPREPVPATDVP